MNCRTGRKPCADDAVRCAMKPMVEHFCAGRVTLVGIDLGKHSFHLHGQDGRGKAVLRKKLGRKQLIEFFATFHSGVVVIEDRHYVSLDARDVTGPLEEIQVALLSHPVIESGVGR
jgi:hypothetical protein